MRLSANEEGAPLRRVARHVYRVRLGGRRRTRAPGGAFYNFCGHGALASRSASRLLGAPRRTEEDARFRGHFTSFANALVQMMEARPCAA